MNTIKYFVVRDMQFARALSSRFRHHALHKPLEVSLFTNVYIDCTVRYILPTVIGTGTHHFLSICVLQPGH